MPEGFYSPWLPGWLAWAVVAGLLGLGGWQLYSCKRYLSEILIGFGLWAGAAVMGYVAIAMGTANDNFAAYNYAGSHPQLGYTTTGPAPVPPTLLCVMCWVIPALALVAVARYLLGSDLVRAAISTVVLVASFTVAAFVMVLLTLANDWCLATSFGWMISGLSVLLLLSAVVYERKRSGGAPLRIAPTGNRSTRAA